ncbi:MAG: hypothetical protein M3167_00285 [Acidobacteriota bacterium]|nr:hypothetical protein [Acidobacteriota bacterium]
MVRCLTYTVRVEDYGPLGTRNLVRAHVHARNTCQDVAFSGGDCWFEIRSKDKFGNTLSREVGRFQDAIPVRGEADTVIEITTGFGEIVEALPWWAAGGGRKAGQ